MNKKIIISTIIILIIIIGCGALIVNNTTQKQTKLVTRVEYQEAENKTQETINTIPVVETKAIETPITEIKDAEIIQPVIDNTTETDIKFGENKVMSIDEYMSSYFGDIVNIIKSEPVTDYESQVNMKNYWIRTIRKVVDKYPERFTEEFRKESFDYVREYFMLPSSQSNFVIAGMNFYWNN